MTESPRDIQEMIAKGQEAFLPHLSVDTVVFGYDKALLKVLLLEVTKGCWVLPGGYIFTDEDLETAAHRALYERTGLLDFFLRQFQTFGAAERSFSKEIKGLFEEMQFPWHEDLWISKRFISVGYYALLDINEAKPTAGLLARSFGWFSLSELPNMLMDHKEITAAALHKLRLDLQAHPVAVHLLPPKFTMPELHRLYEIILETKTDRSRFQKKMLSLGCFERLKERREGVPHKRPYLYKYSDQGAI